MLEIAVLYGCDLSQVFTPIILRLYQPHSLCEKGATRAAAKAALYVFLLPPLREGRLCTDTGDIFYDTDFYSRPYTRGDGAVRSPCRDEAYFYSRPYTRGDGLFFADAQAAENISTRAPTRGATRPF